MNTTEVKVLCPPCIVCGRQAIVFAPRSAVEAWQAGALIQDALPMLDAAQRELLINGTHETCWETMFGDDD